MANEYATLAQLKARLGIGDMADDSVLTEVLEAVSRQIDDHCHRRLYAAAETRYYTASSPELVIVHDFVTVTTLKTDDDGDRVYETAWTATDYDPEPPNAAVLGRPYYQIRARDTKSFTSEYRGVELTASFGYAATTPPVIREACLLQAARIFRRREVPFGILGLPEAGTATWIGQLDPDVRMMLQPYVLSYMQSVW